MRAYLLAVLELFEREQNEAAGFGRVTDAEANAQRRRNRDRGYGAVTDAEVDERATCSPLRAEEATEYRPSLMWASFVSQDRPDPMGVMKRLPQGMSDPNAGHMADLKHFAGSLSIGNKQAAIQCNCRETYKWGEPSNSTV